MSRSATGGSRSQLHEPCPQQPLSTFLAIQNNLDPRETIARQFFEVRAHYGFLKTKSKTAWTLASLSFQYVRSYQLLKCPHEIFTFDPVQSTWIIFPMIPMSLAVIATWLNFKCILSAQMARFCLLFFHFSVLIHSTNLDKAASNALSALLH